MDHAEGMARAQGLAAVTLKNERMHENIALYTNPGSPKLVAKRSMGSIACSSVRAFCNFLSETTEMLMAHHPTAAAVALLLLVFCAAAGGARADESVRRPLPNSDLPIRPSIPATLVLAPSGTLFFPAENGRPFSAAVRIGNSVYTSGMLGLAPNGTLPRDFLAQAANAMQAVADQLKLAGASMNDVYRCNVSLADMNNVQSFNAVYVKYFKPDRLPVRMAVGVNGLGRGAAVEVECDAYVQ